jgi:hypothetical protein
MTDDCLQAAAAFGWDQFNVRLTSLLRDLTVRATQ